MKRSPILTLAAAIAIGSPAFAAPPPAAAAPADEKPVAKKEAVADEKEKAEEKEAAPVADPKKVLAKVDGVAITQGDAEERFLAMYGPRLETMQPAQAAMMREHAMPSIKEELIAKTLLLAAAAKENIGVDQKKFDEMMEQVKASIPPGKTTEEFYAGMKMDEASFKEAIGEEVRINSLLDKRAAEIPAPSDEATKKFYDDNAQQFVQKETAQASHILIKTEGITDEKELAAKKAELEAIRKQVIEKKGENFAEMAEEHSACPSGKRAGGDLGQFERGRMVKEFETAAFGQKVGEIGPIFKTSFGYHFVKVTDRKEAGKITYEEIKDRIAEHLKAEQSNGVIQKYIASLREAAKIEDFTKPAEEKKDAKPEPSVPAGPGTDPVAPSPGKG